MLRPSFGSIQLYAVWIALVNLLVWTQTASAAETKFCLRRLADGFHRPVALELYGDQALIAEHRGVIRRVDLNTGHHSPAADISSRILTSSSWMDHRGLLSIRLIDQRSKSKDQAPGSPLETLLISSSRKSFEGADHDTVVTAIPFSEQGELLINEEYELTRVSQPSSQYNGGQLLSRTRVSTGEKILGKDETVEQIVYLTTGDGAMKNNESTRFNETTLTGKILRMVLTDSSVDSAKGESRRKVSNTLSLSRPKIFASGFRNPWRCATDTRASAAAAGLEQLFCGDTAIDPHPEEEIFLVREGGRYGHPEGGTPADEKPIYRYQLPTGSAVIGGVVYKGKTLEGIQDSFVFGDYVSGKVFALTESLSSSQKWQAEEIPLSWCPVDNNQNSNGNDQGRPDVHIVGFAENHQGELLVLAEDKTKSGLLSGAIFSIEMRSSSTYISSPFTLGQMFALVVLYWAITKF